MPGREEYWDSEKYEIRNWDWEKRNRITYVMTKVNAARKANPAFQQMHHVQLCSIENEHIIAYCKYDVASGQRPADGRES